MKKTIVVFSILAIVLLIYGAMPISEDAPVKRATALFLTNKNTLVQKTHDLLLLLTCNLKADTIKTDSVKKMLFACRLEYKKMEWAIAYYYPSVATRINGTDVLEEEEPEEFEPAHGMQVLENLVLQGSPLDADQKNKLLAETKRLYTTVLSLSEAISFLSNSTNSEMLAALKYEIIKISALGFTEYDNPVMKNYLEESLTALHAVCDNLKLFDGLVSLQLLSATDSIFASASSFIEKSKSADKFNRLDFITKHYTALSLLLDDFAAELNITYASYNPNVDLNAKTIFDLQSFNYFYKDRDSSNHEARISLGKILFFDPVLSGNYKRACASCHHPDKAFTDGLSKSKAFELGQFVDRNAPTVVNACLQVSFFDDSREASLEGQIAAVVNNPKELNNNFTTIVSRLQKSKEYTKLFDAAFPSEPIGANLINKAIADYEKTLVAFNSDFDRYLRGEKNTLSASEINGFNLFMGKAKCGSCHFFPLFNGVIPPLYNKSEFEIIGTLGSNDFKNPHLDKDEGAAKIKNGAEHLKFGFKVPGLRNAALTAPYMHNGSLKTLLEVMNFYNKGGASGFRIDVPNQTLSRDPLELSNQQINDIIHFLESLSDTTGLTSAPITLPKLSPADASFRRVVGGEY